MLEGGEFRAVVYNAARDNKLARLKIFLEPERPPEWYEVCLNSDFNDKKPLVIAAREGRTEVVHYLLSKHADVNTVGTVSFDGEIISNAPALWAASAAGHMEIVQLLLERGAEVNLPTSTNSTPLRGACYDGHLDIVKYLVDHGADIEIANRHGHTPLMIACFRGKTDVVKYLLSKNADLTKYSSKGNTALHDAAEGNHAEICELLVKAGAQLLKDDSRMCPLMCSALLGNEAVIPVLMTLCTDKRKQRDVMKLLGTTRSDKKMDMSGAVAMWREAVEIPLSEEEQRESDEEIAKFEVAAVYGDRTELQTKDDVNAIEGHPEEIHMQSLIIRERVLGGGHVDVHYYLRFRGAVYCDLGKVELCFQLWMHALHLQQKHMTPMHVTTLATLLAFQETFGLALNEHALHQALGRENWPLKGTQVAAIFEKICYELERLHEWGDRPLECCCENELHEHKPEENRERLVLVGLQILLQIYRLALPLHVLSLEDSEDEEQDTGKMEEGQEAVVDVKRLVSVCEKLKILPLHLALTEDDRAESNSFPATYVVERLLRAGADVSAIDSENNTPLHCLLNSERPRMSIVRLLLDAGAPIHARRSDDSTCLDLIELTTPRIVGLKTGSYMTLAGLAANVVRRQLPAGIYHDGVIPGDLVQFVDIH